MYQLVGFVKLFVVGFSKYAGDVPCGSMSMVVTVRCGHCTSLLSVNMMKASFVPLHLLASFSHDDEVFMRVFKLSFNYIYLRIKSKTKIIYVHK